MSPLLSYRYKKDWRFHALVFRAGPGVSAVTRQTRRALVMRAWLVLVFVASTALLLRLGSMWMAAVIGLMGVYYVLDFFFKWKTHDRLARHVLMQLGRRWRAAEPRSISLEFNNVGIRELDGDIEAFCPWGEVKGFTQTPGLLSITLGNGLQAQVPGKGLLPGSSSLVDLTDLLRNRGVPRVDRP